MKIFFNIGEARRKTKIFWSYGGKSKIHVQILNKCNCTIIDVADGYINFLQENEKHEFFIKENTN